jgi:hypothetical protein
MTDPIVPYINLIDASLQGWTLGKVRGKCSPALYRVDGPDEKLLAQLLVYTGDDRENDRVVRTLAAAPLMLREIRRLLLDDASGEPLDLEPLKRLSHHCDQPFTKQGKD